MKIVVEAAHLVARIMHWISGAILIAMMGTVVADILVRSLFAATGGAVKLFFPGAVELVSYGLLLMVLFALPYSVTRGQVIVDMFTEGMSPRLKNVIDGAYVLCFGLLGAMMCRHYLVEFSNAGSFSTTQDLHIPMTVFYGLAALATGLLALRGVLGGLQQVFHVEEVR
ncbi:TRAP transporter small permease subunit [Telmatospirillum sp. J64-1]|uniref:TRAP transporter small permease subunit n=1 Tax=Telmatospirillum sp. J64-1 TaxID=2502183 RepID=UPI00115E4205|nr:TRAP transporter small permease subunit [Telmatospirillum sp. J64-1]